ncbi:MAG: hypothetical protein AMXMBFR58_26120 [Phycisphaerae bacterium]|nr:DUF4259 domain-containing protein [Phycisphaerales bacterium]
MGAWDTGSFDNDDALDHLAIFIEAPEGTGKEKAPGKLALITGPLTTLVDGREKNPRGVIKAPDASVAIAAAELLAAALGRPHPAIADADQSDDDDDFALARQWAAGRGRQEPTLARPQLRELAIKAVTLVRDSSELADLWADAQPEHATAWKGAIEDLLERLRA